MGKKGIFFYISVNESVLQIVKRKWVIEFFIAMAVIQVQFTMSVHHLYLSTLLQSTLKPIQNENYNFGFCEEEKKERLQKL